VLTPTLEDVFLQYTGARFAEAEKKPEPADDGARRAGKGREPRSRGPEPARGARDGGA
jgi:hypothetical protein